MAQRIYQQALDVQSACNLSGVIYSLKEVADKVWEEIRSGTSDVKKFADHPVMRLFAEQIYHLAAHQDWHDAYEICQKKVGEGK